MKKIFKAIILSVLTIFSLNTFFVQPSFAAPPNIDCLNKNIPEEVREAAGCNGNADELPSLIINILNGIIAISGLIAVIFVVYGGIKYMTSAGDSAKTKQAKDTILYATIGLIICALSFAIVNFVIISIIGGGE